MTAIPEACEQRPGEAVNSHARFREWLMAPLPRPVYRELAKRWGIDLSAICELARRHEWQARAAAYDSWVAAPMLEQIRSTMLRDAVEDYQRARSLRLKIEEQMDAAVEGAEALAGLASAHARAAASEQRAIARALPVDPIDTDDGAALPDGVDSIAALRERLDAAESADVGQQGAG